MCLYRTDGKYSNKSVLITDIRRDVECHRGYNLCHTAQKRRVLKMQPLDEQYDIIWRTYMSACDCSEVTRYCGAQVYTSVQ